jgi:hypothetical protein
MLDLARSPSAGRSISLRYRAAEPTAGVRTTTIASAASAP